MPTADNDDDGARFERVTSELNQSLERCRQVLDTHRLRLAANSNDTKPPEVEGPL